jgi:hypothetical protein
MGVLDHQRTRHVDGAADGVAQFEAAAAQVDLAARET